MFDDLEPQEDLEAAYELSVAVTNPPHYTAHPSGIECIEVARHFNFCIGNAVKYLWRAGKKEDNSTKQDLCKAVWYIADEIGKQDPELERQIKAVL